MEGHTSQCRATMLLIVGIILIVARLYTTWDIWVVIGGLLVVKAICIYIMPNCKCTTKKKK